jgi:dTDP-4-amino-4,6-dideoxygalactose transaminase
MQFIDIVAQHLKIADRLEVAINRVVAGGQYILGPEVADFETRLAAYLGPPSETCYCLR